MPEWRGTAKKIGDLWRLTKGRHVAIASLWNHPTRRIALRCEISGELHESHADDDGLALLHLAQTWKGRFQEKGWSS